MTIYDDYVNYCDIYRSKYGPNSIVFIEVGSFWELYDCNEGKGAPVKEITEVLGITMTKKNKNIADVSRQNPMMAGFPTHALDRFLNQLIDKYTIILVSQVTPPPNPKREVTHVLSKGTAVFDFQLKTIDESSQSYIMSVLSRPFKDIRTSKKGVTHSCAGVDLTTGKTVIYNTTDEDDLYIFLNKIRPCELLVIGTESNFNINLYKNSCKNKDAIVYDHTLISLKDLEKIEFQRCILSKIYKFENMLTIHENLNIETHPDIAIAITYLITYAMDHNEKLLSKLNIPEFYSDDKYLYCSQNTFEGLDLPGLERILNQCMTAPGRRYFSWRIRNPMIDKDLIQQSYDTIDKLEEYEQVRSVLKQCFDIERLSRKLTVNKLHPCELGQIVKTLSGLDNLGHKESTDIIDAIKEDILLDSCEHYKRTEIDGRLFKEGRCAVLDDLLLQITSIDTTFSMLIDELNKDGVGGFKLENNERDGHYISVTSKRFKDKQNNGFLFVKDSFKFDINDKDIIVTKQQNGTYSKISNKLFTNLSNERILLVNKVRSISLEKWSDWLHDKSNNVIFSEQLQKAVQFMIDKDFYSCCKRNATLYNYKKPILLNNSSSMFDYKGVRHPIIERVNDNIKYVSNDVSSEKPILLYGLNAAGKSSMMKSIGLNIIMAQSGMYTAVDEMSFSPYTKLFTRIGHVDDLYMGKSTFVCEMSELRNILSKADATSLVLGDELCCGTEHESATAIVSSTIDNLITKECMFIFTTHLHDLVVEKERVNVCHLHVENVDGVLYYDRKLRIGSGSPLYGLEVCQHLGFDQDFLKKAFDYRNKNKTESHNTDIVISKYNSKVIRDECKLCGKVADDVHHITEQHKNTYDKNMKYNLMSVCKECHNKIHDEQVIVEGFVQTSQGLKLKKRDTVTDELNDNGLIIELWKQKMTKKAILSELKKIDKRWTMAKINTMIT